MAITLIHVEWLLAAKRQGVSFRRTLTLGRQHWLVQPGAFEAYCRSKRLPLPSESTGLSYEGWADGFFREYLDVHELVSLDNSAFEGATWIYDLNQPISPDAKEGFDVVLDAGALEHVFNFPTALRNCMSLVAAGGTFMWSMPANNNCGHGFYQFSPELIFRTLCPSNGYEVPYVILTEYDVPSSEYSTRFRSYEVSDPEKVGERVTFISGNPSAMLVSSRRAAVIPIFERWPQQSDYMAKWANALSGAKAPSKWHTWAKQRLFNLPRFVRSMLINCYQRWFQFNLRRRHEFFRKIDHF